MYGMRRHKPPRSDFLREQQFLTKESCLPPSEPPSFFQLHSMGRCCTFRAVCVVSVTLLLTVPLICYYLLSGAETVAWHNDFMLNGQSAHDHVSFSFADDFGVPIQIDATDLKRRVDDLNRIRTSVLNELRSLEWKRRSLREEISALNDKYERLQSDVAVKEKELSNLYNAVEQAELARKEAAERNRPEISLPSPLNPPSDDLSRVHPASDGASCTMDGCFDYSRCSITSGCSIYVYTLDELGLNVSQSLQQMYDIISSSQHATSDPTVACFFVALCTNTKVLSSLKYWRGDGRNHLLIQMGDSELLAPGRAMVAACKFANYRADFDLAVLPFASLPVPNDDFWKELQPLLPSRRKYLLTFWGNRRISTSAEQNSAVALVTDQLKRMQTTKTNDKFYFSFQCQPNDQQQTSFALCGEEDQRAELLQHSTFVLILPEYEGFDGKAASSAVTLLRIYEAIKNGAVPVFLGPSLLPLEEVIDWRLCSFRLPTARISELHFLLRAIDDSDLLEMRRQGRLVFENYLADRKRQLDSVFSLVRTRLGLSAFPVKDFEARPGLSNDSWSPTRITQMPISVDPDEYLGPTEMAHPSLTYRHNWTLLSQHSWWLWNRWFIPSALYPHLPVRTLLPTEAQFQQGTDYGFRPISYGQGGSGKEFSESLGGNEPREQFTAVVLSYEREAVLVSSLQRLNRLPYLNKVIVVWNGPTTPSPETVWPQLHVPVVFVTVGKNSLNNRFLPLKQIETEAILSLDDDVHLTQAEIVFAFRVWREARDRIVGFPGRFHAWEGDQWLYNSNHSCQLSMVLTGAAFLHKFYTYKYTYHMPKAVRDKVDDLMNCEDLAMNFLVSHLTRKPPIKVTSKWTFRCPGCPETLSADQSHFLERHDCMQFFTKVYGYNPLLNTQFRVDSVLFKTRLPHQHQKCFKFI